MNGLPNRNLHPSGPTLALYHSRDLPWQQRWSVKRHLAKCSGCAAEVGDFHCASAALKKDAHEQSVNNWSVLEREMLGNIAVGVAAGRCIEKVGVRSSPLSRAALIMAGLTAVFIAGWFTHIPRAQNEHLFNSLRAFVGLDHGRSSGPVVQTTPDGIAVRAQGATLTILHPRSALVSLTGSSGVAARYVDAETGEVTVTSVYAQ